MLELVTLARLSELLLVRPSIAGPLLKVNRAQIEEQNGKADSAGSAAAGRGVKLRPVFKRYHGTIQLELHKIDEQVRKVR